MNCQWVEERLSAYIDKEVCVEERLQIEDHCQHCETCRTMISQFVAIGTMMRQSEVSVDTDAVWEKVVVSLSSDLASISTKAIAKKWCYAMLVMAASIALIWFAVRHNSSTEHGHDSVHQHASLAVDFQEVFQLAKTEPNVAVSKLEAKYQGRELDQIAATQFLGYEPAIFRNVPEGFARVSTHVLNMPCCKCSATICTRSDGTSLIVFEHKDEQPVWFGDSPSIETQCSGKACTIAESAGQLAVSWMNENRQLTVIGANDIAEVNQWVASMEL